MNISTNTSTNNILSEYDIVDSGRIGQNQTSGAVAGKKDDDLLDTGAVSAVLSQEAENVSGTEALKGANVEPLAAQVREKVPARHSAAKDVLGFIKMIGRVFMKACHAIRNVFAPAAKSIPELQADLVRRVSEGNAGKLQKPVGGPVVSYGTEAMGAAFGLRGRMTVKAFTNEEIDDIRTNNFSLADIKQDPNLQNCWFLSSLQSFLTAKGPAGIGKLITIPDPLSTGPDGVPKAQVHLGGFTYEVPLGEVRGDGKSGVSFSKPWVKLIETAMQMHLLHLDQINANYVTGGLKIDMHEGLPKIGLGALLGDTVHDDRYIGKNTLSPTVLECLPNAGSLKTDIEEIKTALTEGRAVVLGSPKNNTLSLGTGISPGHAVSVQNVIGTGNEHRYIQVLDPYNRSVIIDADYLADGFKLFIEPKNQKQQQQPGQVSG